MLAPAGTESSSRYAPSSEVTEMSTASAEGFTSVSAGGGPVGAAKMLGTDTVGEGRYHAKSDPASKPVVCQTAATRGSAAETWTVYDPIARPLSSISTGCPATSGTVCG